MDIAKKEYSSKAEMYAAMALHIKESFQETTDICAALSNISAMLALYLEHVNWAGFYIMKNVPEHGKGQMLVLGPFQGKPAVALIEAGSGVCGTAVESRTQQRVDDVTRCCNHIACDVATASEIVTPIFVNGGVWGVIDIDSPLPSRFDEEDEDGMKLLAETLGELLGRPSTMDM
ncbi:MAG: GAF domain-containing protein [Lachnospiraceae bacterium]|nr:GAF domain-containing protein [Lachnospiraceae bacterium]